MTTKMLRKVFMIAALSGGLLATGCDMIDKLKGAKKDDSSSSKKKKSSDDDDDDDDSKKPSSSASAAATASAAPTADASAAPTASAATPAPTDDVTHYPDEVPQSGTFVTKKNFTIYQAADTTSKEIGHLGPGTIIELKATHQNWMLINWPSGVGELSPGWVQVKPHDTTIAATNDPIDAGKPVDAGITLDAGKVVVVDAGNKGRIPVVKVPVPGHH